MCGFALILLGQGLELLAIFLILWTSGLDGRVKRLSLAVYNGARRAWPWSKRRHVSATVHLSGAGGATASGGANIGVIAEPELQTLEQIADRVRFLDQRITEVQKSASKANQETLEEVRREASELRGDAIRREDGIRADLAKREAELTRSRWTEGIIFMVGVLVTLVGTAIQGPT